MTHFLRRRGGRYHFRRAVPVELVALFGKREIVLSTGTSQKRVANQRARALGVATDQLFEMAMTEPRLSSKDLERIAQRWFADALERVENDIASEPEMSPERVMQWVQSRQANHLNFLIRLQRNDLSMGQVLARNALNEREVKFSENEPTFLALCRLMTRGLVEISRISTSRTAGEYGVDSEDPVFKQAAIEALEPKTNTMREEMHSSSRSEVVQFSKLLPKFMEHTALERHITAQSLALEKTSFKLFVDVCGDRPIDSYSKGDLGIFRDTLMALPARWASDARWRNLSPKMAAKASKGEAVERTKVPTVRRHFTALKAIFNYAMERGLTGENPAAGFSFKDKRTRKEKSREPWTAGDLGELFGSPVWTGCLGKRRRASVGSVIVHDAMFWVPLLAIYSGAREGELCQLYREDIAEIDGVPMFRVTGEGDRQIKNEFSERTVPLHPRLIEWGFLDFVERVASHPSDPLFPELQKGGPRGTRAFSFSKRFNHYLNSIGLKAKRKDFHSIRHSVQTKLAELDVSEALKDRIMGRAGVGSGNAIYTHGNQITLNAVRDVIARIQWPTVEAHLSKSPYEKPLLADLPSPRSRIRR